MRELRQRISEGWNDSGGEMAHDKRKSRGNDQRGRRETISSNPFTSKEATSHRQKECIPNVHFLSSAS